MRHPQEISSELEKMSTFVDLTGVFEGIASLKIAQIKNQVLHSTEFFQELWTIYKQVQVDASFHYGRRTASGKILNKELFIIITAEGGFSGDIDQKLIDWMLSHYNKERHDIIVIGHHGAIQLAQRGVAIKKYFKLPLRDKNINVAPIISEVQKYKASTAYYQTYVSLMVQDVKRISLLSAVEDLGKNSEATESDEVISEKNYIFEPSTYAVVDHLERSMMNIMLGQIILESKLAQYASRFRAMSAANDKAKEQHSDLTLLYNRSKRSINDQRLKEIIAGLRRAKSVV